METIISQQLIEAYLQAYNHFDVEGMVGLLHDEVVFRNAADGEITLATTGKALFREQAEQATAYFSRREQRVTGWQTIGQGIEVGIDYTATVAINLPNGLQPGDTLRLQGKSVFQFEAGKIISIEDIS